MIQSIAESTTHSSSRSDVEMHEMEKKFDINVMKKKLSYENKKVKKYVLPDLMELGFKHVSKENFINELKKYMDIDTNLKDLNILTVYKKIVDTLIDNNRVITNNFNAEVYKMIEQYVNKNYMKMEEFTLKREGKRYKQTKSVEGNNDIENILINYKVLEEFLEKQNNTHHLECIKEHYEYIKNQQEFYKNLKPTCIENKIVCLLYKHKILDVEALSTDEFLNISELKDENVSQEIMLALYKLEENGTIQYDRVYNTIKLKK